MPAVPPGACERCGAPLPAGRACPRHPGARRLDLSRPADRAWAHSLALLRRQRQLRWLRAMLGILAFVVGIWALGRGHDTSTVATGRSFAAELGLVLLWLAVELGARIALRRLEQGKQQQPETEAPERPGREAQRQVEAHHPEAAGRHLGARAAAEPAAHQG